MQPITPFLWFDNQAEEAAQFYVSVFQDAKMGTVSRYGEDGPGEPGSAMVATFEIMGLEFAALNGGPMFRFTEAISFVINCDSQAEVDEMWTKLTADGGEEGQCGWLKDKFGLSWQVVPVVLGEMLTDEDEEKAGRVMAAMMEMRKIDIAALRRAYDGTPAAAR
jgi:predicted 3-demethylubiquinone-9 3-methyltransferase (glyoxalase superfamily)